MFNPTNNDNDNISLIFGKQYGNKFNIVMILSYYYHQGLTSIREALEPPRPAAQRQATPAQPPPVIEDRVAVAKAALRQAQRALTRAQARRRC